MMTPDFGGPVTANPWQRYLKREQADREIYLNRVQAAYYEYLAGPWPDRDAYGVAERDAWYTYYQAVRSAWQAYRAEMERLQAPPPASRPHSHATEGTGWVSASRPGPGPQPSYTPTMDDDH